MDDLNQQSTPYIGTFRHKLDAKNRVAMPSKWRVSGDEGDYYLALSYKQEDRQFIKVYTPRKVQDMRRRIDAMPENPRKHMLAQSIFGQGYSFGCDANGRIMIPDELKRHAGIDRDAVFVADADGFAIWSSNRWDAHLQKLEETGFDPFSAMAELGL